MGELRFHPNGTRQAALKHSLAHGRTPAHEDARDERADRIAELRSEGLSLREIGRRFRLSGQRVNEILAERDSRAIAKLERLSGGRIRGDDADLWLRENDPAYAARDRDLRRGVKRLPEQLRRTG